MFFYSGNSPQSATLNAATVTTIEAENQRRGYVYLYNLATTDDELIFIGVGENAEVNKGIVIPPGGAYEMNCLNMSTAKLTAIAVTGTPVLSYLIGLRA
jgi:hypothetical protein